MGVVMTPRLAHVEARSGPDGARSALDLRSVDAWTAYRSLGKKGETPVVETTGARHGISLISAITSKGHMRFMIKESGGVNADVFIEFLNDF